MKKRIILGEVISLIFLLSLFTYTVSADPAIMVADYSISPEILLPGDNALLTLTISNGEASSSRSVADTTGGTTTTTTKTIGATINKIWIVQSGTNEIWALSGYEDVGYLAPGTSIDITFKLKAYRNISEGTYLPTARIDVQSYTDVQYPIPIKVSNDTVDLISSSVPSSVSIIGSTDITLKIINNREAAVGSVKITPQEVTGISFMPETQLISSLAAKSSQEVTFSIIPTEIGEKNLTFDMSWKNGDNVHSGNAMFSVGIVDTPDVSPVIHSIPSTVETGKTGSVRLKVYNAKSSELSSVIVTPISDAQVTPSQYFIGSIDPDDIYSVSFDIDTKGLMMNETYDIDFVVSFKQDNQYYEIPAVTSSFTVVPTTDGNDSTMIAGGAFFIIIIIVVFLYLRRRKQRSRK